MGGVDRKEEMMNLIFKMVRVLELAYGGWLFIIFDYGRGLAGSFCFKSGLLFRGGRISDLGSFAQAEGLPVKWCLGKK